jgi:hypothetical protein
VTHDPHEFYGAGQCVCHHRVIRGDALPVGLALDRVKLTFALKPGPTAQAQLILAYRVPGAGRDGLDGVRIEMLANPAPPELRGVGVEIVFAQPKADVQLAESDGAGAALGFGAMRQSAGTGVVLRLAQQVQPA